jgi:16S rRNA processing protein RimM
MNEDRICIGAIGGSFGVHGETRIKSFCATPEDIETYSPLQTEDGTSYPIVLVRAIKGGFAARLGGVETKESADALKGAHLFAPRDRLPSLPDDEYYHADLVDLLVLDTGGVELGRVQSVQNHGSNDMLEIHGPKLKNTVFIPFTLAMVPTVDLTAGRVIVDPPEGMFD